MTDLFLEVLNTSFAATWVVLAVVAARFLLRKAPRWMVCSLWALVAARLLIGSGIPAHWSMIPSAEVIPPQSLYDQAPVIHSGVTILDDAINPVYTESLRPMPGASVNPLQVWTAVVANLWILGAAVMVIWAVISWYRVRRQVRESICVDGVYLCDRIASPFIFGLVRPKIYLPSDLSEYSRTHVIAHERAHLRRRDHWWKPLGFCLLTVNWFNPAMWLAYILLCRDIEMACDEKVVCDFGVEEKKAYSAALLRCSVNSRRITACPLAFGEVGVKQRVKSVLNYKKPAFWVILAAVVLITVLAAGLLTSPVERDGVIRYNGNLYELVNQNYSFLPAEDPVGNLADILHNTTQYPTEDFQGTNLNEDLIGSPFYLEDDLLYLPKDDGYCLAFRRIRPHAFLARELERDLEFMIIAEENGTDNWEEINGSQKEMLRHLLEPLTTTTQFTPISENMAPHHILAIDYFADAGLDIIFRLSLSSDDIWTLHFYDVELGSNYWQFRSKDLSSWAQEYLHPSEPKLDLGIKLHLEDITPSGATLVCTQDGTLWNEIITGAPWFIQKYEDGDWVDLMPESTVWTAEAYGIPIGGSSAFQLNWGSMVGSLESGQYRIGKRFTGYAKTSLHQADSVPVDQTCYAEFLIGYYENPDDYSPEMYQAIRDSWNAYDAMDPMERLYLSSTPGSCTREFEDWEALERFVGQSIPNPLEDLDSLEKGNWAAAPVGFNGGARFHISFSGTREGQILAVNVQSGYRRGDIRVSLNASPTGRRTQSGSAYQIISDEGDGFEARTITVHSGTIEYTLRAMGEPGTGAELISLLQELIPHFEEIA